MDYMNMSDEDRCTVSNPKEIGQVLDDLAKNKSMINVSFNQGQDQCLTTVIAVDREKNIAYLDIGIDEGFNKRLASSTEITFTKNEGVKVKWKCLGITITKLKDGHALKIKFPQSLVRLQRREFFRLKTPIVNPLICKIPLINPEFPDDEKTLELTLQDVSLGGIGAFTVNPLPPQIEEGAIFDDCKIQFPDIGETLVSLCVRNIKQLNMHDRSIRYRLGLEFIQPSRGNQSLIQRYVFNLERDLITLTQRK
ncbi:MAG: flagellar brake protein [Methylophilaceae bacterium]